MRVRSRFEQVTAATLRSKEFEEFLPLIRSRRRWSDRVKYIEVPLFTGYVFCRFDPARRVPILESPGVVGIVGFGDHPAPIPDEEIQSVRLMLGSDLLVEPYPRLQSGQKIRIDRGPLAGVEGTVVAIKKGFRLVASITLLQRSIAVEIEREWAEPVAPAWRPAGLATRTAMTPLMHARVH